MELLAHTHFLAVAGSRATGLARADSDVDLKGVLIAPAAAYHGFLERIDQVDDAESMEVFRPLLTDQEQAAAERTKVEGSVYELQKFCRLAADSNPNLIELLFCRDAEVRHITPLGQKLRDHRELFVSQRARHTFSGYAAAQLRRIRGHRRWLLEPPSGPPNREDYGLPPRTLIPQDQLAAAESAIRKQVDRWEIDFGQLAQSQILHIQSQISRVLSHLTQTSDSRWKSGARSIGIAENFIDLLDREKRYSNARKDWKQFCEWQKKRNPQRAQLEASFGYDTKHGAHLVRLLRMGREILESGEVRVWRGDHDAVELQAIRDGAWSYEELVEWAEAEEQTLSSIVDGGRARVPAHPDLAAVDSLTVELVEAALAGR